MKGEAYMYGKPQVMTHDSGGVVDVGSKFSGKLTNRMRAAFSRASLQFIGGQLDGKTTAGHHFMPAFTGAAYLPTGDPLKDASFNAVLPQVTAILLGEGNSQDSNYIDAIGGDDYLHLPQIAIDLAAERDTRIVLREVFGATGEMPMRGLSYLLPALQLQEDLHKKGVVPPQLQVVFANHLSTAMNGMDYQQAKGQSGLLSTVAKTYINSFFPDITDRVVLLEDTPLRAGTEVGDALQLLSETLRKGGKGAVKEALLRKGLDQDIDRSITYGAAHVLFHDTAPGGLVMPIQDDQPAAIEPTTIISIGGLQERFFYQLRQQLKLLTELPNPVRTMQLFTRHHVPPYYMARGGDVSLAAVLQGDEIPSQLPNTVLRDLQYLEKVSNSRGNFKAFIKSLSGEKIL